MFPGVTMRTKSPSFLFFVISCAGVYLTLAQKTCRTPEDHVGICIPVKDCKPIMDLVTYSQPLSQANFPHIYQCGLLGTTIKACCPNTPFEIEPPVPPSPDIGGHRNLNLLPSECGVSDQKFNSVPDFLRFPWMAVLTYLRRGNQVDFGCTGTVINNWYILTSAHCLYNLVSLRLIGVRVGEYNMDSQVDCEQSSSGVEVCAPEVQDIAVSEILPHPNYNPGTSEFDIGLVRLATPMDTSVSNVKPTCLPTTAGLRNKNFATVKPTITGWGFRQGNSNPKLLKEQVIVTSGKTCREAYKKHVIDYRKLCAGYEENKGDPCISEGGGPLQASFHHNSKSRYVQFGVLSLGSRKCGREGFPAVYTRVEYHMDWILDNLKP